MFFLLFEIRKVFKNSLLNKYGSNRSSNNSFYNPSGVLANPSIVIEFSILIIIICYY